MDEYISRHEAIRAVQLSYGNYEATRKAIFEIPSADVAPVVHCKDCKRSGVTELGKRFCSEPMGAFYGCIPVDDDYFCSGGARMDGAE